jgi:hypothetical protein
MEKEKTYTGENEKWFEFNKLITIRRDDNIPYLVRRTLISFGSWFSIKYHKILVSDDPCNHDHPWPFLTIILKGGYYEWTPDTQKDSGEYVNHGYGVDGKKENCHFHKPGSIMYRPANWIHRLELPHYYEPSSIKLKERPAHTLVFTGKVIRDWGIWTKTGWIFWKNYDKRKHC